MKKGIISILLFGIFLVLPTSGQSADKMAHPEIPRITAQELKQLMDNKSEYLLIDTRDGGSYSKGHIKGAINIQFDPSGDPMARKMTLMALPTDKLIITYCD